MQTQARPLLLWFPASETRGIGPDDTENRARFDAFSPRSLSSVCVKTSTTKVKLASDSLTPDAVDIQIYCCVAPLKKTTSKLMMMQEKLSRLSRLRITPAGATVVKFCDAM